MSKHFYKVVYGQTVFDLALQFYGNVEGVEYLLRDNEGIINEQGDIDVSQTIRIRKGLAIDAYVLDSYAGYVPTTDGNHEGIEYVLIDDNGDFLIDHNGDTPTNL